MIIFVDSSALISLGIRSEQRHMLARNFLLELPPKTRLVTSNFVLDETLTHLNSRLGGDAAYKFGDSLLQSSLYDVAEIDSALFHEAMKLLKKFRDKNLSFTDLTSFAFMRLNKIHKAFAFDSDFIKAGFEIVPT